MMDTKTLVVGQEVYMLSGPFGCEGKVIKVSAEGVEVQIKSRGPMITETGLLRFDSNGKGRDEEGTHECGPWHIMPSYMLSEETVPFMQWWNEATYEQRLVVVKRYYDSVSPQVKSKWIPAEDLANGGDFGSETLDYCLADELARFRS
jgi:hypothetical protein